MNLKMNIIFFFNTKPIKIHVSYEILDSPSEARRRYAIHGSFSRRYSNV